MDSELYDLKSEQINLLFQLVAESDEKAFNRLFRSSFAPLVLFASRYVRDKSAAGDMVQDTFIKLWQKRETLSDVHSARSYLYRAVRNYCLNYLRDHAREQSMEEQQQQSSYFDGRYTPAFDITEQDVASQTDQRMKLLLKWVSSLPDRQREAFELSRFEGLDHDEIASVMGVSAKTVNNHITGALQGIRRLKASYEKKKLSLNKWQKVSGT